MGYMYEEKIFSVPLFLESLRFYASPFWIFRGHANFDWKLLPTAGRDGYYSEKVEIYRHSRQFPPFDISRFEDWRQSAKAYRNDLPVNDFESLAIAQHFGLATRFMDWSSNPLVALFFAVESCSETDGCVYCYAPKHVLDSDTAVLGELKLICCYPPPPIDNRILAQQGLFTYHPHPNEVLTPESLPSNMEEGDSYPHNENLIRFTIDPQLKHSLKRELHRIGVNRKYLFADLDGLSRDINWETMDSVDRKETYGGKV